jgi:hypothetical protein
MIRKFYWWFYEVLICGDFNARTGGLPDFIQNDDKNDNFNECPVPPNYTPDKQ